MQKRKWLIALIIVALVAFGFWLWWRAPESSLKQGVKQEAQKLAPEISVASLNITDIDEDKISAISKVELKNNLPVEVKTSRLDYTVYMDSAKIIESSYTKPITLRASGNTAITLPMTILHKKLVAVLKRYDDKKIDSADYSIKAKFQVDVPIAGERNFSMDLTKRLPAVRLLKTKVQDIDIGTLGLKETGIDVVVKIENPNVFPIKMKDARYKFTIDNDENVMEGTMEKMVNIPAHGTEPVSMHIDMKTMKVPKLGWKMLFDKKDTQFKMNFSCKLVSDNEIFNNSTMVTNMNGTLQELKDAVTKK